MVQFDFLKMETNKNEIADNIVAGFGISACVAMIFNTILVWLKETIPAFNAWMKALTSHHWITQGVLVVAMFIFLGFVLNKMKIQLGVHLLIRLILISSIFSGLGIIGWFMIY